MQDVTERIFDETTSQIEFMLWIIKDHVEGVTIASENNRGVKKLS